MLSEEEVFGVPNRYHLHNALCCEDWDTKESIGTDTISLNSGVEKYVDRTRNLSSFRRHVQERGHSLPFEPLAAQFRYRNVTNARDKLYGLLGMCHYSGCSPPIDYNRPVTDCYKVMTSWMICESRALHVLNMIVTQPPQRHHSRRSSNDDHSDQLVGHLSSWCPNWNASPPDMSLLPVMGVRKFDSMFYKASGEAYDTDQLLQKLVFAQDDPEMPNTSPAGITLHTPVETDDFWRTSDDIILPGLEFDTVKAVDMMPEQIGSSKFGTSLPVWRKLAESTLTAGILKDSMYTSGQCDAEEAFMRTICADVIRRRIPQDPTIFPAIPVFFSNDEDSDATSEMIARFWAAANSMNPGDVHEDLFSRQCGRISSAIQVATANRRARVHFNCR